MSAISDAAYTREKPGPVLGENKNKCYCKQREDLGGDSLPDNRLYDADEALANICGEPLSSEPYLDYLQNKFL